MSESRIIRIKHEKQSFDWFAFNQIVCPLLKGDEITLFLNLIGQARINRLMGSKECELKTFTNNYGIEEDHMEEILERLQQNHLLRYEEGERGFLITVNPIESLGQMINHDFFRNSLHQTLTRDKFQEIIHLSEGLEKGTLNEKEDWQTTETYAKFYGGVRAKTNEDFLVTPESLDILKNKADGIDMDDLADMAHMSMVKKGNQCQISSIHLSFLINAHLNSHQAQFSIDDHAGFWSSLPTANEDYIKNRFKFLFRQHHPFDLYKLLTGKQKIPDSVSEWIIDQIKMNSYTYPAINALMSFVMCLIGKIPFKYISKTSQTLCTNYSPNRIGIIKLVMEVIKSDIKNGKNRLNANVPQDLFPDRKIKNEPIRENWKINEKEKGI